jgi:hypothetical protein
MLLALFLLAAPAAWLPECVPMRWNFENIKSLDLVKSTPVNCLLVERDRWSPQLVKATADAGMRLLGVVRPGDAAVDSVQQAAALKMAAVVFEGDFPPDVSRKLRAIAGDLRLAIVEMPMRSRMRFDDTNPVIATYQGVWPGIQVEDGKSTKSAPSGAPWIDTNTGFLRFVHAATKATIWLGNGPPAKTEVTGARYLQAICDAAISGGRWVISLDAGFTKRLENRDPNAVRDWQRIAGQLAYFESHPEWRTLRPAGQLALIEDADTGALMSGGILDMIAVKHTPVRPVPNFRLSDAAMKDSKMAVDVDPAGLTPTQKEVLTRFTRSGGTLLSAPPGWKFPPAKPGQITLADSDIKVLDEIWKEMNTMTGRRNLGARLFNVSSMLSNLLVSPDGKRTVLHLVNFSDYPVESVTVHMLGKYNSATLLAPGEAPRALPLEETEEGTGVDIPKVAVSAAIVLE